ncbi:MAG: N-acetylglucosamine-6-phosphate deacetylase [Treponema sp.]|jgi:N-acetylglucosamine-6-phosphate deacetylase|nr:N-acetylglucosamine-6-phosphate deacetylase [Treponema sp.]
MVNCYTHARLVLNDRILADGFLLEDKGLILETGPMDKAPAGDMRRIPCKGFYLSPGFIDIHTHGGDGHDFMDGTEEAFINAALLHLRHGTTTLLPTTLTSTDEDLFKTIELFKKARKTAGLPCLPGLHLEGPYFSREQCGAQNPAYIRNPAPEHYEKILELAEGSVLRWSVAPELEGALEMGRRLSARGILMSIGHSNATYDEVLAAADNGYSHITHFYSCMSSIIRRKGYRIPGIIESAYLMDSLTVEIIADGFHLPPELLRLIVKCKDNEKICLVTDSMRGAGEKEGPTILGSLKEGFPAIIEDGVAKLPDRSAFAGSVSTADRLVRVMVEQAGLPLEKAVAMMTRIPAGILGLSRKGSLLPGKDADMVIFDDKINIKRIFVHGRPV